MTPKTYDIMTIICRSDRLIQILNRVQKDYISLRTKLVISFNWAKSMPWQRQLESHSFHLRLKKSWRSGGVVSCLSKNLVKPNLGLTIKGFPTENARIKKGTLFQPSRIIGLTSVTISTVSCV